jgi:drug/metabolite transporter (DMT)-like permease
VTAFLAVVAVLGVSASAPIMAVTAAPPLTIAFWRNAIATIALTPVALTRRRDEMRSLTARDVRLCVVSGVMLAGHFGTWVTSLRMTSVAAATALVATSAAWVAVIERFHGGVVVRRGVVVGLAVSFAGVLVVSGVDFTVSTRALLGDLLALAGAVFAAVYTICGAKARVRLSTVTYTSLCYGVCAVVLLIGCLVVGGPIVDLPAEAWIAIAAVTVCAQFLGHTIINHLLDRLSAQVVSLVLLTEVPGAALLAAVFIGQVPAAGVWIGLALVLAGLAIVVGRPGRRTDPDRSA